jgi:catechol 2,3-dioxygenase-like lactoylglutathione lyase family enzyme
MGITVEELDHIVIRVADVDASLRFYCETLGLQPDRLTEFRAGEIKFPSARIGPGTIIDLFPAKQPNTGKNVDHIALTVAEAPEAIRAFLAANGIGIVRETPKNSGARGFGHSFYVHDPDENLVELRTYRKAAG